MKLDPRIEQLLQSDNEDTRLRGVKELAANGVEQHLDCIYRAMGDQSWRVRKEAIELFFAVPNAAALTGEIIELLHSHENAGLRNAAVDILVRFGRQAIPELLEELTCNDHDVRKFIIDILGDIGDERAIAGLVTALDDEDNNVRAAAAENLGKLRARETAPILLRAMQSGDLMFKFTSLEALAQMQAQIDVNDLLPFQSEQLLRKALFDCLGLIGDASAMPVLVAAVSDEMRNVAEAAVLAMVRLMRRHAAEVKQALAALSGSRTVTQIVRLLDSRSGEVRHAIVTLLGYIGDDVAVASLMPLLEDQKLAQQTAEALVSIGRSNPATLLKLWEPASIPQRVYLAYLYGEAGCVDSIGELREGLRGTETPLRHAAAQSLGRLGDVTALPALVESLDDDSDEVREAIVAALSRLGEGYPGETFRAVSPLLESENSALRTSAVTVLGRLQGVDVDRALAFALKDESAEVRRSAVRSMEGRDGDEQIQALKLALTDEDVDVRRMATEILGQCHDQDIHEALQLALRDEDLWVRSTAVRSLGMTGRSDVLPLVATALQDPVGLVVIAALETLAERTQAAKHLLSALDHADEEVVNSALKLLASQDNTEWIGSHGEQLLNHKNWEVRLSTARSLAVCQGPACMPLLEARLLIEGEDLVRLELRDLLEALNENMD